MTTCLKNTTLASADEEAIPPCPNKQIEAVMQTSSIESSVANIVFRLKSSHKEIGSFCLGGYSKYALLIWSPDGQYAALQTHFTRHTMELFVFRVGTDGIQQVKIQDYQQNIYGRLGVLHGGRGSVDKPLKWLGADRLLISARGALDDSEEDSGYHYEVEIHIIPDGSDLVGWLEKIKPVKSDE